MDVLTDILASLRLTGGVVIDAETRGDFCMLVADSTRRIASVSRSAPTS